MKSATDLWALNQPLANKPARGKKTSTRMPVAAQFCCASWQYLSSCHMSTSRPTLETREMAEDADAVEAGEGTVPLRIMAVPFFKPHEYKSATGFEPENTKDLAIAQSLQ